MSSKLKRYIGAAIGAALVCGGVLAGCGSTTNNDQGTSFLATGFFGDVGGETGLSGLRVLLVSDIPAISGALGIIDLDQEDDIFVLPADGADVYIFMGLQNRLATQFMRVVRIDCSYDIPGASISIPDDSYNSSFVISAAGTGTNGSNIQNGNVIEPAEGYVSFTVLSTDLMSYLNVNRASLPALPFRMTATCRAVGVSQSGDVFETNDLYFPITMVEEAETPTSSVGQIGSTTTSTTTTTTIPGP